MAAINLDLNQITMLALTLMVGIVIDDAIIVLENIYRYMEEKGLPPFQAAIEGTGEIGLAVMATTASLLAVFLPIGFMGGIIGRFLSSFGFTASFAIAVSLLVSFTLTPMLCSRFVKMPPRTDAASHRSSKDSRFFRFLDGNYTRMLEWSMAHRKSMVALSVVVSLSTIPLVLVVGKSFVPNEDRSEFQVYVRAPEGTSLAGTLTVAERIARDIRSFPGVTTTLTSVGTTGERRLWGADGQSTANRAGIYVKLVPKDQRKLSQDDLMIRARTLLTNYPKDLHTSVSQANGPGGGQADVQFVISGPDLDKLDSYSKIFMEKMGKIPYATDIDTSLVFGKPELRVEIDRQRAADLGVRVNDIAVALNTLVAGQVVSTFNSDGEQYDVRLQTPRVNIGTSVEGLTQMTVASTTRPGGWVPLDQVVRIRGGTAPSSIGRRDRQRNVTLGANVLPGRLAGRRDQCHPATSRRKSKLGARLQHRPARHQPRARAHAVYYFRRRHRPDVHLHVHRAGGAIRIVPASPFTILLTLPIAIPFGIFSLWAAGQTINVSIPALGMLLLFGIVKKNAILQIDHTNGLRALGLPRHEAIIQANRDRLRPILMTTMALVAGMLPLVLSTGDGALDEPLHRRAGRRRAEPVSAIDAPGGPGVLFALRRYEEPSHRPQDLPAQAGCGSLRRIIHSAAGAIWHGGSRLMRSANSRLTRDWRAAEKLQWPLDDSRGSARAMPETATCRSRECK